MANVIYPLEYNAEMPFVHFIGKKYQYSKATGKDVEQNYRKTGDTVALYMPGSFSESVNDNWSQEQVIGGGISGFDQSLGNAAAQAASNELVNIGKALVGKKISATFSAAGGVTSAPTDMLIFNAIEPVKLSFRFQLMPYSAAEAQAINMIIQTFKKKMLPKLAKKSEIVYLEYPIVWDVFFTGVAGLGVEYNNAYPDMALISCNVSYSHGEGFMVFHDKQPVQTNLELNFQSIRRPTQGDLVL